MNRVETEIGFTQEALYKYAAKQGYEPSSFSDAFLASDFCRKAFDTVYSRFQFETPMECMDFLLPEIEDKLEKTTDADAGLAGYVGFMYRYLYFITPYSSREILAKVSYDEVAKTEFPSMVNGEHLVVEEICWKCGLEYDEEKI